MAWPAGRIAVEKASDVAVVAAARHTDHVSYVTDEATLATRDTNLIDSCILI